MSIIKSSSNLPKRSFRTAKILKAEKTYTNEKVVTRPKNDFSIKNILPRFYVWDIEIALKASCNND